MAVKPIPDGYHTITPYLIVNDSARAIDFYTKAFGAIELFRMPMPNGKVGHAEIKIGDSIIMMGDEMPEMNIKAPTSYGGTSVGLLVYVTDCDAVFKKAVDAGAKIDRPMMDQFYGDRSGTLIDPFGHKWSISTHKEDLTPEQVAKRHEEWVKKQGTK